MVHTPRLNVVIITSVLKMVGDGTLTLPVLPPAAKRSAHSLPWWLSLLLIRNTIPEARILTRRIRLPRVHLRRLHHHRLRAILVILTTSNSMDLEQELRLEALIRQLALRRTLTTSATTDFPLRILRTVALTPPGLSIRQEAFTRKSPFLLHPATALLKRMVPTLTMRTTSTCSRTTIRIVMVILTR
jgi:hypothetical protein